MSFVFSFAIVLYVVPFVFHVYTIKNVSIMYNVYAMVRIESKYSICIRICLQFANAAKTNKTIKTTKHAVQQEHRCIRHSTDVSLQM